MYTARETLHKKGTPMRFLAVLLMSVWTVAASIFLGWQTNPAKTVEWIRWANREVIKPYVSADRALLTDQALSQTYALAVMLAVPVLLLLIIFRQAKVSRRLRRDLIEAELTVDIDDEEEIDEDEVDEDEEDEEELTPGETVAKLEADLVAAKKRVGDAEAYVKRLDKIGQELPELQKRVNALPDNDYLIAKSGEFADAFNAVDDKLKVIETGWPNPEGEDEEDVTIDIWLKAQESEVAALPGRIEQAKGLVVKLDEMVEQVKAIKLEDGQLPSIDEINKRRNDVVGALEKAREALLAITEDDDWNYIDKDGDAVDGTLEDYLEDLALQIAEAEENAAKVPALLEKLAGCEAAVAALNTPDLPDNDKVVERMEALKKTLEELREKLEPLVGENGDPNSWDHLDAVGDEESGSFEDAIVGFTAFVQILKGRLGTSQKLVAKLVELETAAKTIRQEAEAVPQPKGLKRRVDALTRDLQAVTALVPDED